MSAPTVERATTAPNGVLLLATDPPRLGPVSRRLLLRLAIVLAIVQIVGAVLTFVVGGDVARAAGLSLTLPGGGFLYDAWPLLFLATLGLLVLAWVLWWGISTHFAIPLVWAASVVGAVALADGPRLFVDRDTNWDWAVPVVYVIAIALVGYAGYRFESKYRRKRAKVPELNEYLAAIDLPEASRAVRRPEAMDAELVRWCYDFADQPDDGLKGLDWGEQFHGGTQLRYQLNSLTWALSLYAVNYVPNARHQITEALSRVVLKHTDLRVWGYWRTLNLLGNFDTNPDPIARDNIMFSAFLGDALNMFEASTGSTRFDAPGSLTFVWKDGRTFEYDHHGINDAVLANYERSALGFFPCEPGWSFTVCNIFGAQSLFGHDTLHGTDTWPAVSDRWRQTLEQEYLTPDGHYSHIRSNHVGLSWDTGEVPGGEYYAHANNRFADILPAHARRARALDTRGVAPKMDALAATMVDGELTMEMPEEYERHRARKTALMGWTKLVAGARMVGRDDVAEAAVRAAARQCGTRQRWPERPLATGLMGLGGHMMVRWSTPTDLTTLNQRGYQPPVGPVVTDTRWADVLVVLARSTDGVTLELTLEPRVGHAVPGLDLTLTQLRPGAEYVVGSRRFVADGDGCGAVTVDVDGRTDLTVAPA